MTARELIKQLLELDDLDSQVRVYDGPATVQVRKAEIWRHQRGPTLRLTETVVISQ